MEQSSNTPSTYYAVYSCGQTNAFFSSQSIKLPAASQPANTTYFVIDYVSAWILFSALEAMSPVFFLSFAVPGANSTTSNGEHYFLAQPSYELSGGSMFVISQAVKIAVNATPGVTLNSPNISMGLKQYLFQISGHYE